jgi:zinc D-Ala-D-Ala dipeptidase
MRLINPLLLVFAGAFVILSSAARAADLPQNFVRLKDVAPQIEQDIRYFRNHNFVGRPIAGYDAPECILTRAAAMALAAAAHQLAADGLGLKVYDCYRPKRAVADFVAWARDIKNQTMKSEFYPRVDKAKLFEFGYIAEKSGHSRGSTIDLAIVQIGHPYLPPWKPGEPLADCALPVGERFADATLDFGTGYDCFDTKAHHGADGVSAEATANRLKLKGLMGRNGFKPYQEEWWHYTLANEPFRDTYFDFPVGAAR